LHRLSGAALAVGAQVRFWRCGELRGWRYRVRLRMFTVFMCD